MNTPNRQLHRVVVVLLMLTSLMAVLPRTASAQDTSDAAHRCQDGGWEHLRGTDGTTFANQGECVSYAAQGGGLEAKSVAKLTLTTNVVTSFNYYAVVGTGFTPGAAITFTVLTDTGFGGTYGLPLIADSAGAFSVDGGWGCGGSHGTVNTMTATDGTNTASVTQPILC